MSVRPFRLVAPVAPETDLQEAVAQALDLLLLPPAEWCAYPAGYIKLTGQQAAKLARMSVATLRRRAKEGLLRLVRVGSRTLVADDSLRRMLGVETAE